MLMKKMFKVFIALSMVVVLSGCAISRPDISREDWKVKTYSDVSKAELIRAAREVVRLADPDDVYFEEKTDGFNATRYQIFYHVVESGKEVYEIEFTVREVGGKMETRLDIEERVDRASFVSLGLPVIRTGRPEGKYIYDLFNSRLNYLLGRGDRWFSCKDALDQIFAEFGKSGEAGDLGLGAFCGQYADDRVPSVSNNSSTGGSIFE